MAGNLAGAQLRAAGRLGISLAEYQHRVATEKWCVWHKAWHPRTDYNVERGRGDGLCAICRSGQAERHKETYHSRATGAPHGPAPASPRDGDRLQARHRVNHLVDIGLLPDPNALPCSDCGHVWVKGGKRHEYDHHEGYGADSHEVVEAVCSSCHHERERKRRAA